MTNFKRIVLICAAVWLCLAMLAVLFFGRAATAAEHDFTVVDDREFVGEPSVFRSDIIAINKVHFQLWGIRAPKMDQICWGNTMPFRCGDWAKERLEGLLRDSVVRCDYTGRRIRGFPDFLVARCWLLEGGAIAQNVLTVPLPKLPPLVPRLQLHEMEIDGWDGTSSPERFVVFESSQGLDIAEWMVREGWAFDYHPESSGEYAEAMAEAWTNRNGLWTFRFIFPWSWEAGRRGPWAAIHGPWAGG